MIAVINDISFNYPYETADNAIKGVHDFLDICKLIESDEVTNIDSIKTGIIDTQIEMAPGYKLAKLVQEFKEREERSFLLSILVNRPSYNELSECLCSIDGKDSFLCAYGIDNFIISLMSDKLFMDPVIEGIIDNKNVELRNISKNDHINFYRKELGIRKYSANSNKHKFDRENPYGKGKVASRMDLNDSDAQKLLNRAVYIDGRLYAKKDGYYYAFQNEGDVNYHGYRADDLKENITRKLDKQFS